MPAIADVAQEIAAKNLPVLFVDTCSVLDVIRSTQRLDAGQVKSALLIARAASSAPPECVIVRASVVEDEYNRHKPGALGLLETDIKKVIDVLNTLDLLAEAIGFQRIVERPSLSMITNVVDIAQYMFDHALVCDSNQDVSVAAGKRVMEPRAPAKQGKEAYKDCCLFEEYLAVMNEVRMQDSNVPAAFITSNVTDFGDINKRVHPDVIHDSSVFGLAVCTNWSHAHHVLFGATREN